MFKGLKENHDYSKAQVEVFHKPSETWYPLVSTKSKIVFYTDNEGNTRRAHLKSITDVNFINGLENTNPVSLETADEAPASEPMGDTILTNTNYVNSGLEVNHVDKGWFSLVRTSNKVIFYLEDGNVRKMTPGKFGGVRNPAEEPAPFEETVDNFLYDMVG